VSKSTHRKSVARPTQNQILERVGNTEDVTRPVLRRYHCQWDRGGAFGNIVVAPQIPRTGRVMIVNRNTFVSERIIKIGSLLLTQGLIGRIFDTGTDPKRTCASPLPRIRHSIRKTVLFIRSKVQTVRIILDVVRSTGLSRSNRLHGHCASKSS
jgi:hypothetical protein